MDTFSSPPTELCFEQAQLGRSPSVSSHFSLLHPLGDGGHGLTADVSSVVSDTPSSSFGNGDVSFPIPPGGQTCTTVRAPNILTIVTDNGREVFLLSYLWQEPATVCSAFTLRLARRWDIVEGGKLRLEFGQMKDLPFYSKTVNDYTHLQTYSK